MGFQSRTCGAFRRVKDRMYKYDSPLLKKTRVRQVVSDERLPLNVAFPRPRPGHLFASEGQGGTCSWSLLNVIADCCVLLY